MIDTLIKTEKKATHRTIERNYTLSLYPRANVVLAKVVTKDTDIKRSKPVTTWYLFSQAIYDKYKHRKTWTWIINLDRDELLAVVSTKYMDHYLSGHSHQYPDDKLRYVAESGWKKILDTGNYSRIAHDKTWYDGMMYDPQGNPIRRAFHCDYINGGVRSSSYEIAKVEEWLKRHESVKNLERISIPYYNAESCGEQAIEFTFQPSPKVFLRMCKEKVLTTTFERSEFIRKYLGIDRFRRDESL